MEKAILFSQISTALIEMEADKVVELCKQSLGLGIPAYETISEALVVGMDRVSQLYEDEEYYLPEVLVCSDALNAGLDILKPHLDKDAMSDPIKVVIGVVEGDTHDIGKNLVRIMMEVAGIEVYDLGKDVKLEQFIQKAEEVKSDFIGMSTLMTTTMDGMRTVIEGLVEKGIRANYKVLIGGGPISQNFADRIGADVYAKDAAEAVRKVKQLGGK